MGTVERSFGRSSPIANRNKVRSNVEWQASDKVSVQATGEYNNEDYLQSVYGLKTKTAEIRSQRPLPLKNSAGTPTTS